MRRSFGSGLVGVSVLVVYPPFEGCRGSVAFPVMVRPLIRLDSKQTLGEFFRRRGQVQETEPKQNRKIKF